MTEIITRAEARMLGLKRYFTGQTCGRGHCVERYVTSCACVACASTHMNKWQAENRAARSRYAKEFRYPERVFEREKRKNSKELRRQERELHHRQRLEAKAAVANQRMMQQQLARIAADKRRTRHCACVVCLKGFSTKTYNRIVCSPECRRIRKTKQVLGYYRQDPQAKREIAHKSRQRHLEKRRLESRQYQKRPEYRTRMKKKREKINDLVAVLRSEMPDLLKVFDL